MMLGKRQKCCDHLQSCDRDGRRFIHASYDRAIVRSSGKQCLREVAKLDSGEFGTGFNL